MTLPEIIVIASILKPTDDVRHYQKIAKSLYNGQCQIYTLGFGVGISPNQTGAEHIGICQSKRLGIGRFLAKFRALYWFFKLKPNYLVVCTHELLGVASIFSLLKKTTIVYDLQENYAFNHFYGRTELFPINYLIGVSIRFKEILLSPFVDRFILAEQIYQQQLNFLKKGNTFIAENKSLFLPTSNHITDEVYCIVGTLSEEYGTLQGIDFFIKKLNANSNAKLKIVGSSHTETYRKSILKKVNNNPDIECVVSGKPLPNSQIEEALKGSKGIIMPYRFSKATKGRIPTKLWDALVLNKQIYISFEPTLAERFGAFQNIHFVDFSESKLLEIDNTKKMLSADNLSWESEEQMLKDFVFKS